MNDWKTAVTTKTAELIGKGYRPALASKCALKACKHLHPAHKTATARNLALTDAHNDRLTTLATAGDAMAAHLVNRG